MIELKNIRGEWDHSNLQSYETEPIKKPVSWNIYHVEIIEL
jgi:hypothetical protein